MLVDSHNWIDITLRIWFSLTAVSVIYVGWKRNRSTVVWDYIAVYQPGTLWQDAPPKPVYSDGSVRDVIGGAKDAIRRLLTSGSSLR